MPNPDRFRDRIMHKEKPTDFGDNTIRTWHEMMKEYGWIPLDQFRTLPAITIDALCEEINKDRKEIQRQNERNKNRGKR